MWIVLIHACCCADSAFAEACAPLPLTICACARGVPHAATAATASVTMYVGVFIWMSLWLRSPDTVGCKAETPEPFEIHASPAASSALRATVYASGVDAVASGSSGGGCRA